jgi:hypothetical protein
MVKLVRMSETELAAQLPALRSRVDPLEKLVHALAERLPAPLRYHSGQRHHGFRYGKPDVRHFCLLKAVRAVSALNAAIELARCDRSLRFGPEDAVDSLRPRSPLAECAIGEQHNAGSTP